MYPEKLVFIALGANLPFGDIAPENTLRQALDCICEQGLSLENCSPFYRTPAFPAGAGPDYVNAVASFRFCDDHDVAELLIKLHKIEAEFGRTRQVRWGGRTLDLDLLAVGQEIAPNSEVHAHWRALSSQEQARLAPEELVLPHPRIQDRAFVLVPFNDVAPDWVHPTLGQSVRQMLADLPQADRDEVVPF